MFRLPINKVEKKIIHNTSFRIVTTYNFPRFRMHGAVF